MTEKHVFECYTNSMKKISILISAYNEEDVLDHLYQRLGKLANDNKN